jgi:two-component system, chemotaxis family, protein-glutamate methylesterase/glutaminase
MKKTKVLVIDDSALMRELLSTLIAHDPHLEVVGTAPDPYVAWNKIQLLNPDVITLDVEMPKMDGITFLEKLMRARPMPVVMVSTLTARGCETTLRALELGAVDYVTKPSLDVTRTTREIAAELIAKVNAAALAKVQRRRAASSSTSTGVRVSVVPRREDRPTPTALLKSTEQVVAIAASTGGTEALRAVLAALPSDCPGIVIVQHMPPLFTSQFAQRLDKLCSIRVREATDGERILRGVALVAPGNRHMEVVRSGAHYSVRLLDSAPVNHHRPAADVLFPSCASALGANAVAVVLTGMGADGARGLAAMKRAGARTVAQDEASCVVFGMPKEAIATGCVDHVVSLDRIAETILALAQ